MPTDNHQYDTPDKGTADWHLPLNSNFNLLDADVEIRDTEANLNNYTPKSGAKFTANDTGAVYLGDGSAWQLFGKYPSPEDAGMPPGPLNLKRWMDDKGFGDIGAAFNDAAAFIANNHGGGTIYLPAGQYELATQIQWTGQNVPGQVRFVGAGMDATSLDPVTAGDNAIAMIDLGQHEGPEMGQMSISSAGNNNRTIRLGASGETIAGDQGHVAFPYLHNLHLQGDGTEGNHICLNIDHVYWGSYNRVNVQNGKLLVSGTVSRGVHKLCQYKNAGGQNAVEFEDNTAGQQFEECKFVSGQPGGSAKQGSTGGGNEVIWAADLEATEGPLRISEESFAFGVGYAGVDADSRGAFVINSNIASGTRPPPNTYASSKTNRLSGWGGKGPGGRSPIQDAEGYLYNHSFASITQGDRIAFVGAVPSGWTTAGAGTDEAPSKAGAPLQLTTGSTTNNARSLSWGGQNGLQLNRDGFSNFYVNLNDTSDIRVEVGIRTDGGYVARASYNTGDGDTTWQLETDSGSSNLGVPVSTSQLYKIGTSWEYDSGINGARYGAQIETPSLSESSRTHEGDGTAGEFDTFEPYVEIETLTNDDKSLDIHKHEWAQIAAHMPIDSDA